MISHKMDEQAIADTRTWIAHLRSGEYEQGRNALRTDGKFCCVGVACDTIIPNVIRHPGLYGFTYADRPFTLFNSVLSERGTDGIYRFFNLSIPASLFPVKEGWLMGVHSEEEILNILIYLNDEAGWTFLQIADWAESILEEMEK